MRGRTGLPLLVASALVVLLTLTVAGAPAPDRSTPPAIDPGDALRAPPCDDRRLSSGVRLLVVERPAVASVHLVWSVSAGSADDPPHRPGVAALLAAALVHEPRRGGESLAERLSDRGVLLDAEVDRDSIRFAIQAPADRLRWAVRRLRRALFRVPATAGTARALARDAAARLYRDPERLLHAAAWRAAYGPTHPYGRPAPGTPAALDAIGLEDLRRFHREQFRPERMVVTAAGDVDIAALHRELQRVRPSRATVAPPATQAAGAESGRPGGGRIVLVNRPGADFATIGLASPLSHDLDAMDPAALVANELLGGRSYSRLLGALRNDLGYAYDARSRIEFRRRGALLVASSTVGAESAGPALRRLLAEVEALHREPPAEEIARARVSLTNGMAAGWFETNRSAAWAWARLTLLGLDGPALDERLRKIAVLQGEETARFAREHLQPGRFVLLVVGDAQALEEQLDDPDFGSLEVWEAGASRSFDADASAGDGPRGR